MPRTHPRLLTAILSFCGVVVALMQTIIVPMLPELPGLTHSSPSDVSWLVTATLLTGAVFTPLLGRAGDMYGKRQVLLAALSLLVVGSVVCAVTSALPLLIIGRGLEGAALAVVPLGISIMRDELPADRVPSAVALMSSTVGIGAAVGLPIAALVVEYADWHSMFWFAAVLGLFDMLLIWRLVPESPLRTRGRFDTVGALGLTACLVCLLLAVTKASAWGFGSPTTLGLLAAALVIGLAWGRYELGTGSPLIDLRVSARPTVLFANLAALFIGFAFYANSLATTQLVQEPRSTGYGLGASIVVSGMCLLPGGLCMAVLSPVSAQISMRRGPKTTVALAAAVIAVGYGVRFFTSHELWTIILGATVVAAGTGLAYSALPMLLMADIPMSETAAANGLNTLMRMIGQSMSSAVSAAVLAGLTMNVAGRTVPTLHAYLVIFVVAAAGAVVALLITLLVPARRAKSRVLVPA